MNSRNKTFRLVLRAILLAIIIVQAMVPWLGFIPLGFISLTIIHITVIIAAVVLGPKDGMVIGLFWELLQLSVPTPCRQRHLIHWYSRTRLFR